MTAFIAAIVEGEADLADVWFLIAAILAFVCAALVAVNTRDAIVPLTAGAIGFVALGLLFI